MSGKHARRIEEGWTLTVLGENVYGISQEPILAKVPSSVYSVLLEKGLMPDPFYRDNELDATKLMENDFAYEVSFTLLEEERASRRLVLRFDGIDTLSEIWLDGELLGSTDNMHRVYEFDITAFAAEPVHQLKVVLHSPTRFIREAYEKDPIGGSQDAMDGYPHLRKAACMFGWDWGPRLPDAGLYRPVSIVSVDTARIDHVQYRQRHEVTERTARGNQVAAVTLHASAAVQWVETEDSREPLQVVFTAVTPDGSKTYSACTGPVDAGEASAGDNVTGLSLWKTAQVFAELTIPDPELWWPNGYGKQPLYTVRAALVKTGGSGILDVTEHRIGLRTLTVNTDPLPDEKKDPHLKNQLPDLDEGRSYTLTQAGERVTVSPQEAKPLEGRNFAIEVNGLQIFAMGADYIPEDNLLTRQNRRRTELLLETARESHFNVIRVWGGGCYPDDDFYDLCDEKGLIVWQDFMFACAAYELTEPFEENITAEIRQQLRRLRHHACLGIWCGNNENEGQFESYVWPRTQKQFYDYIRMYEYLIPHLVHEEDPDTFYWPSSQSSGGNFENTNAENRGDMHYWGVWHGGEPFTAYRSHHYRFLSEFGFQSFPAMETVRRFTQEGDRNVFSRVMELHQRNSAANGKILQYLSQTYLYPKNFDQLIYASQLLQADAIRYGVEHFRRFRGTCMGTVVWQLDDCWPVASWASVDYYGNWKALQYAEKRMFAPVLLSCEEHGEVDQKPFPNSMPHPVDISADLHVANETANEIEGIVRWSLRLPDSSIVREGSFEVGVSAYSGAWLPHLDFNGEDPLRVHLYYELEVGGKILSSGTSLFCAPKHYRFEDPELTVRREVDTLTVSSRKFARSVCIETAEGDKILRLDDNFVDMEAGERTFRILPGRDFTTDLTPPEGEFRVRSVYDIAE